MLKEKCYSGIFQAWEGICFINVYCLFLPDWSPHTQYTHTRTYTAFLFTVGKNPLSPSNIHPGKLLNDFLSVPAVCSGWLQVDRASQESLGLKRLQGPQISRREGECMVTCWCCTQYVKIPLREWDTPPKPHLSTSLCLYILLPPAPSATFLFIWLAASILQRQTDGNFLYFVSVVSFKE